MWSDFRLSVRSTKPNGVSVYESKQHWQSVGAERYPISGLERSGQGLGRLGPFGRGTHPAGAQKKRHLVCYDSFISG